MVSGLSVFPSLGAVPLRYRTVQHTQKLKCGDPPQPCSRVVPKLRTKCMHEVTVPCPVDPDEVPPS